MLRHSDLSLATTWTPRAGRTARLGAVVIGLTLTIAQPRSAPSAQTLYLHGTGAQTAPTLLLTADPPGPGAPRYKDSPVLFFQGGNAWKDIGSWTSESSFATGIVDLDLWLGLKAAETNAAYDLRAQIVEDNDDKTVLGVGQALCVTGLAQDPGGAKRVTVQLTPPGQVTGSIATRRLLRLSARVGTTPSGARCVPPATASGAPGLRVYFDSADRASSITVPSSPPPPPPVNHPPTFTSAPATNAKHLFPYSYQATASDPDGDALTFTLGSGPQGMTVGSSGLVQWTPTGNQIGAQAVSVVVTDAQNASATQSFQVVVADATSPAIALTMPSETLPGSPVTARALANDNVGVASVTFEVNGADPIVDDAPPFERTVTVPGTATAGTEYHVHAVARDAAGNTAAVDGTFKVAAQPDTNPPTIALNAPPEAAPGTIVHLTASAADANGVTSVTFKRGDTVLLVDVEPPFETTYTVPVDAAVGSSIAFQARALDFANNFADANGSVLVVAAPDTTPPTVQLTAPPQVQEGSTLALSAIAGDNVGVASVRFLVNGVEVATATAAPYAATFKLPSSVKPGDVLHSEARASDFAGLTAMSAQDTQVLAAPNRPPTANAGGPYASQAGSQIQFSAAASSDPDTGDVLTYDWNFGDGTTGAGVSPRHAYSAAGSYVATVTVNDGREGSNSAQATVTVVTATDHTAPHVTLHAPSTVVPGSQVTVTAQATDDQGVASVTFDINGSDPTADAAAPYQRIVQVPAVASPGDQIVVHATARDAAGNQGHADATLTISAVPDTQNPSVTLNAPPQAAAGTTIHLSATATDNVGIQSVIFTVKGNPVATLSAPPFEATYPVAANETPASTLDVAARAIDFTGNESSASGLVTIAAASASDTMPPTVTLSAPLQVRPGKTLTLSATAADNVGVAGVAFFVDSVHVSTSSAAPYTSTITVDPAAIAGSILHLEARAVDFSGLQTTATGQTLVIAGASAGQGIVTGEVYDDGAGLPIAGVTATLAGHDSNGAAYAESAISDARGRWTIYAAEGEGVVRFAKAGWTRADRHATIVANEARELVDARLTALTIAQPLSPVLGGTVNANTTKLVVPPGALQAATDLALTTLSQQGLAGVLPVGWSPLAAADITPHGVTFAGGATLSMSNVPAVAAGRHIVVGSWDEQAALWRAIGDLTAPGGSVSLEFAVPSSGQFAFLVADLLPRPPPVPAIGDGIAGAEPQPLAVDLDTAINPQPKILFYKPDAHSEVRGTIAAPTAPTSSGARIMARITESYSFLNGTTLHPEGFAEDLFFYQAGAPAAGVAARFIVTPSQAFDPFSLQSGVISVELVAPGESSGVPTVGPGGGTATAPTGESLAVPQGATGEPLPLTIQGLTPASLGIPLPSDVTLAGSALLTFQGSLAKPATFSVPKPAAVTDASRLLLVRAQELGGQTRLVLVGRATIAGDRIASDTSLPGIPDAFEGVRVAGRYLFVQIAAPIGFETGTVLGIGGGAFQGALVSTDTLPIVALSGAAGHYAIASKTGAVNVTALDLQNADAVTKPATVPNAGAVVQLPLQIAASVPRVTSIVPVDGATNVPLSSPIVIHFSKPIVPASVNATTLSLTGPDGLAVTASITFADQNTTATLRPSAPLVSNAAYTVNVLDAIVDVAGRHLLSAVSAHFTGLNTAPPPAPPAGTIQASLPDATGFTTVTGTQGSAGVHDTVTILNVTTGTSTPVLVDANGSFSVRVAAKVTDKLQIVITSANGSQTVAAIGGFRQTNADGSVSAAVAPAGGLIEGPAGTAVEVPEGAFPDGAIITINKIDEAQFPVQLDADAKALIGFSGGVQLDLGGKTPEKYLNVFVAAGPNDHPKDQWLVSRARDNNGVPVLDVVDTAKLIGGRIRTSSPPCPGVTTGGTFAVYKSAQPIGLSYAHMSSSGYGGMQMQATMMFASLLGVPWFVLEPPVPGPICYPVLTGKVTVTANSQLVTIPAGQLTPADREIVVKNTTRNTEAHFPRNVLEFTFEVTGAQADGFTVVVKDANGQETPVTSVTVTEGAAGKVLIHLDPDTIPVSVASVAITNVATSNKTIFGQAQVALQLAVAGGAADTYEVTAIDAGDHTRSITPGAVLSPNGAGNMRARAVAGTIDPAGRTKVLLNNATQSTSIEIPAATIVDGGFTFAFDGGLSDRYSVVVFYDNGQQITIEVPTFRITVQNRTTGRVIKTIVAPAPPRDEPLNLGVISDDTDPPILTSGPVRLINFDPNGFLTFTFNEAMDPDSLKAGLVVELVRNGQHIRVTGEIRVSNGNRTVTFVPNVAFGVGEEFFITFVGDDALGRSLAPGARAVTDRSGNALATTRFRMTTFTPRPVSTILAEKEASSGEPIAFRDVEVRRKTVGEQLKTYLAAVTDSRLGHRLAIYDVTDPLNPVLQPQKAQGGNGKKRLVLLPDIGTPAHPAMTLRKETPLCDGTVTSIFKGDLAVATSWNTYNSYLSFYDLTDPSKPCWLANKLLTASPDTLSDYSRPGTVHALGFARGVATIQHAQGYAAYAAVGEVGLFAADIGKNIPEHDPSTRVQEGMYPGDYYDVVNVSDRLFAANRGDSRLDIFDPSLAPLRSIDLPAPPRRITTVSGYGVDLDEDGLITPAEQFDLALVAVDDPLTGFHAIEVVDITNDADLRVVGEVVMPGIIRDLAFDPDRRRLFAAGEAQAHPGSDAVFMIDLSNPFRTGVVDADGDGGDDRIMWRHAYPSTVGGIRLDRNRGLLYVASDEVIHLWAVYDGCCDLSVDMTARAPKRQTGDQQALFAKERKALQQEIAAGLQSAVTACGTQLSSLAILEQGSGACLWKGNPVIACGKAYQPGLSDHDYEVYFPAAVPDGVQKCTVGELSTRFLDPQTGDPKEITVDDGSTITFEDVTFFPFRREDFESAKLNVEPPKSSGGDATGDLGLGRQQLLLLWLLGGEYVPLPQLPAVSPGRALDAILQDLKTVTGIPRLEGFEWANLQSFNLAKSKALLRLTGASDSASSLHPIFVKQLHDAAKTGIRAAFGRLIADVAGNNAATRVTRQAYGTNACLAVTETVTNPNKWLEKPCTSFEDYAASAIARTLRGAAPLPLFTLADVYRIHRFYRVKADEDRITSEADADAFIADVWQFLEQSKAATQPIYQQQIGTMPDSAQRTTNLNNAVAKRLAALKNATITLEPHLFNRGFRGADQVAVGMYRTDAAGSGQLVKSIRVDLAGGEERILDFAHNPDGTLKVDEGNQAVPIFELGPIDLTAGAGTLHGVSFTIDLPERKVAEAVRDNNVGGFFYYALDVQNPTAPTPPPVPNVPFDPSVLEPSPECESIPALGVTQRLITSDGKILTGDVVELGLGETVTIELVVTNRSGDVQTGVTVCSAITNLCYDAGSLKVGETKTITVTFTAPAIGRYLDATPSVLSTEGGIVTGAPMRIVASCEPYSIVPHEKDANPVMSEAMFGGRALRYYKVVNKRSGAPRGNATVDFELNGFFGPGESTQHFTFKTDAEGRIFDPAIPMPEGAIPGLPIAATTQMVAGSVYQGTIRSVDGVAFACSVPLAFEFQPTDRAFTRSYSRGSSIEGSIGLLVSAELGGEAGMAIEKKEKYHGGAQSLNLTTSAKLSGKLGVEFTLGYKQEAGDEKLELGAEIGVSTTRLTSWTAKHSFDYPLDQSKNCAIAELTLAGIAGVNPLLVKLLDLARTNPCGNPSQYLKSTSRSFGREAAGKASLSLKATAPLPEEIPIDKRLNANFGVNGGAGFGIDITRSRGYDVPTHGADPVSLSEQYTLKGSIDLKAGLEVKAADPNKPPKTDQDKQEEKVSIETQKRALKTSISEGLAENYTVTFTYDFSKPRPEGGYPSSVDVSYQPPKTFGWKRYVNSPEENLAGGAGRKLTYTIEDPADVKILVDGLANLDAIRKANVGVGLLNEITLAPTLLNDELATFRTLLREINATYTITESKGEADQKPLGFKGKLGPFKLGAKIGVKAEHKVAYTIEKGVVIKGAPYVLETYAKDQYVSNQDLGLFDAVATTVNSLVESFAPAHFSDVNGVISNQGTTRLRSTFTATMDIDGTKEPASFEAQLFSWRFRPIDGPVQDARYMPADTAGPRGAPHYGVGSFHQFAPDGYELAVPTPLVIDYTDEEVAGIDESTLRIYGWNETTEDWDLVGGVVDAAANTVTAPVSTFRLYTLGPAMPARDISLTVHDDGTTGVGDTATQRFTVTSGPLVTNTGQPVANGTLYTVRPLVPGSSLLTPYGTMLTADADPVRGEVQVAAQGGVIQFQVEYPAPNGLYIPGRLAVYSTTGTAFGQIVAEKP